MLASFRPNLAYPKHRSPSKLSRISPNTPRHSDHNFFSRQTDITQERYSMTKFNISIIALLLLITAGAALAASNSTEITLASAATLAGNKLDPGTYTVKWTGQADNLTVSLKSGKKEITTQAKTIANEAPMSST